MMLEEKIRYKAAGIAVFCVAALLAIMRICIFFVADALESLGKSDVFVEYLTDTIWSIASQVLVCLLVPFLIYKFYQKRTVKQIISDANYKRVKWWVPLASVPIAIGCYLVTIIISVLWLSYLISTGYIYNSGMSFYPDTFNPWLFLLSIFLTGVLPAVCEEFAMRGNFLTAMRHTYRSVGVIMISALAFGLFHQNIIQVFYTAFFGAFAVFLVIKTGSVIPAVVIHFVNNSFSVFIGHDAAYGWGLAEAMDSAVANYYGIPLFLILGGGLIVGFTMLILRQAKKDNAYIPAVMLYKPSLRENAWIIGALIITVVSTLFTYFYSF